MPILYKKLSEIQNQDSLLSLDFERVYLV